ncbi:MULTISPECIES: ABC transporter ATP-binding protein [unclassified Granulicatella]|uniref:ABC transporter ATP-binding protein n=1 Tax=unclassified Granulicatella TaxID=2630493 RepID=UPI0010732078|nr:MULTISPECIES: ABC transporter ATP-binding protein [unclassified Granulicatella]MBF0780054.1 ABC transporter ATP-binding protein [Granulicatella sp. 19428wC4_WM01]TFU95841.1 ABC transporter ATP-binding protein [Granulicatella sp. WM01]
MSESNYVIEMKNITKKFGDFTANNNINLQVKKGEIHALLGENGAGKSTLMNMLCGLLQPTSGEILINGNPVKITSPSAASKMKIGMVHQHFMLVKKFTVTENIILGSEPIIAGIVNLKHAKKEIENLSKQYNLDINPDALISDITVGMEQRVEILKTLYRGADILIFDEPTAVLTPQEIDELIKIIKGLAAEGKSIIIITHKLDEIRAVADRCTVIRRGEVIDTVEVANVQSQELADMMVGRSVSFKTEKAPAQPKEPVLEIKNLWVNESRGLPIVKGVDLTIHAGEVLGIAGVDGNGQSELIQAIAGLAKATNGSIHLNGKDITNHSPRYITKSGLGHIPEDRHKHGLVLDMSVEENIILQTYYKKPFSRMGFLDDKIISSYSLHLINEFDVRTPHEKVKVSALSGGNQQKAIIAREVDRNPELLIAAQPTRGLDVGAIEFIHKRLIDQRTHGKAVLLMSFELDEIMNVADRIAVMHDGKIVGIVKPEETNERELGLLMAGVKHDKSNVTVGGSNV